MFPQGKPLPTLFKLFRSIARGGACYPYIMYKKWKLRKTSCYKALARLENNLALWFLGLDSTKIVEIVLICWKTWLPGLGLFSLYIYRATDNFFCELCIYPIFSLTIRRIWELLQSLVRWLWRCYFGYSFACMVLSRTYLRYHLGIDLQLQYSL